MAGCIGGTAAPATGSGGGGIAGCPTAAPAHAPAGSTATATIATPKGTIVIALQADLAPAAVGNFIALARCGYYDGVVFQRLVSGFVIQGGDGQYGRSPNVDMNRVGSGSPGYTIDDDPVHTPYVRGVVAMARTAKPHSGSSQFFIVLDDSAAGSLSQANTYAIMGHVTTGMDVVDAIAAMATHGPQNDQADVPVPMTKVTITTP
ncbi:MAG TPA: peptidylprolyl isomerase [Candidatus Acidoferrum sp.]|nr:peptidylprolyl isomerase [Candidatus Acidoferrum sp.]